MTRWISLCVGILLLAVLVACTSAPQETARTATPRLSTPTPAPKTAIPTPTPAPTRGATPTVTPAIPVRVTADGRLAFVDHRKLAFGTSGNVGQINVSEQDKVTKGQVLAKLDTISLERAVKTAELAVKTAEIDRQQAEHNIKIAQIDLEQATDNFRKVTYPYTYSTLVFDVPAALDYINTAERQMGEAQKILQPEPTSTQYHEALYQLKQAQDNLTKGRQQLARGAGQDVFQTQLLPVKDFWTLRTAQLQMEKAKSALDNAQIAFNKAALALDKARYDVDTAKDTLDKATITAPFAGVIAKVNIKEGDVLSSGNYATTIAMEIIDPSRMELNIKVNELDIPKVKLGQKVTIRMDALPDKRFESVVTSISPLADIVAGVVSFEVKTVFDVPQNLALKAGMGATADIILD